MEPEILVTGAAGLLGARVVRALLPDFHVMSCSHIRPTAFAPMQVANVQIDLNNRDEVAKTLSRFSFKLIINCAGATDVDRCEQEHWWAMQGNFGIPESLAMASERLGFRLIHISSDYVFDGKHGRPLELRYPSPINYYGHSKMKGENAVMDADIGALIIRVCSLYSVALDSPRNIYKTIASTLLEGKPYFAATDLYSNPTEVEDLAQAIYQLAPFPKLPPFIHLASPEYLSRYQFALKIAEKLGVDPKLVKRTTQLKLNLAAKRPAYAGLRSDIAETLLGRSLRTFSEVTNSNP
jgi:dTDP-4-dehydrorhamnose reductase